MEGLERKKGQEDSWPGQLFQGLLVPESLGLFLGPASPVLPDPPEENLGIDRGGRSRELVLGPKEDMTDLVRIKLGNLREGEIVGLLDKDRANLVEGDRLTYDGGAGVGVSKVGSALAWDMVSRTLSSSSWIISSTRSFLISGWFSRSIRKRSCLR